MLLLEKILKSFIEIKTLVIKVIVFQSVLLQKNIIGAMNLIPSFISF